MSDSTVGDIREMEDLAMKPINRNLVTIGLLLSLVTCVVPALAQTTAAKSVSPELIGNLTKQLKVTPEQATGGAGSLFNLAKSRLKAEDFAKVSKAVPGMDGLLKAAPKQDNSALNSVTSAIPGKSSGLASVAGQFKSLGLSPDIAAQFVPILTKFVGDKGGAAVGALLAGVLK
ncbi:MAG TPA: DUF2780 domain-containing protein [Terriglobia bacterium]|nr:DUF2780 domain-containing protein [Terriglobia bacterium]